MTGAPPAIDPVQTSGTLPRDCEVAIIGGGIIGLVAALTLVERGVPVVVLEKGSLAGEQSSRNLGWVRKMGRGLADLPLALESDRLWDAMPQRVGSDVGYRRTGILYSVRNEAQLEPHRAWLDAVGGQHLDSQLVSNAEIADLVPGGEERWHGGIYTASDGKAEPQLAASAITRAAMARGATIVENCAVRGLSLTGGHVSAVVTERGELPCKAAILAGGVWSRRFLGNYGVSLPTLPVVASALRTHPIAGPTDIAVGAPDFSFRKDHSGGFTITQRGGFIAPLTLDSVLLARQYLPVLRKEWKQIRLSIGSHFLDDLSMPRRWKVSQPSPFETHRTVNPDVSETLNGEALANLRAAWPVFKDARVAHSWAGMIDITPDSHPVIAPVDAIPGLILASGFSGHGFGTSPAAGQLAADLATGSRPIVDPAPYALSRFRSRG